ncbi:MAG: putative baseplate assembly protein [Alphaproteobacteria bacterium]|nr:putative baseplate assembly protein [Alphaproteobacteria bacterium]
MIAEGVGSPPLNGIDYLEVLDGDLPPSSLDRQKYLIVYLFHPPQVTFTTGNLSITGGSRITTINVEWVHLAADLAASPLTQPSDITRTGDWIIAKNLAGIIVGSTFAIAPNLLDRALIVRVDKPGDFTEYTLKLVSALGSTALISGFDNVFSQVTFSFKADCPTDLDCRQDSTAGETAGTSPDIDYLARDFTSLRRMMLDRLSLVLPDWEERTAADLGVTLVELLAYFGDYLSYYQDAVATEAYLSTARRRPSVRRHARLLDYHVHDGNNARTWASFTLAASASDVVLAAQTQLLTRVVGLGVVLDDDEYEAALYQSPEVFETMYEVTLQKERNEIRIHTWGDGQCHLQAGATSAVLAKTGSLTLAAGDVLVFEEVRSPTSGLASEANPTRRHAVRLTEDPTASVDAVFGTDLLEITWSSEDALPFSLPVRMVDDGSGGTTPSCIVHGNVVLADHGRTVSNEALALPEQGQRYSPTLLENELSFAEELDVTDLTLSASAMMQQAPRDAVPLISLSEGGRIWLPRRDLLSSGHDAQEFVVEMEEDGSAKLRFGDNLLGRRPTAATSFVATYRIGRGTSGNIGADSLYHIYLSNDTGEIEGVCNPIAASGGTDPETLQDVKRFAPQAFRSLKRAVTPEDYVTLAEKHEDVQAAVATLEWTGSWSTMLVAIDRLGGDEVDDDFVEEMLTYLEPYRLMGGDIRIRGPVYVPLRVALTVCVDSDYSQSQVHRSLRKRFSAEELEDGTLGFFHPDNFTFGDTVYFSQIVKAAMAVPGVHIVYTEVDEDEGIELLFERWGMGDQGELAAGRIETDEFEVPRVDSDPDRPENGTISFTLIGGL